MTTQDNKPTKAQDVAELTRLEGKFVEDLNSGNDQAAEQDITDSTAIADRDPEAFEEVVTNLTKGL